jgi:hypothetical protein
VTIGELLSALQRLRPEDHVAVRLPDWRILWVSSWELDDGGGVILHAREPQADSE